MFVLQFLYKLLLTPPLPPPLLLPLLLLPAFVQQAYFSRDHFR